MHMLASIVHPRSFCDRRGEMTAQVFRRSVQQFGLRLSDPELEALMRKYRTHTGEIDYIRFIQCLG